MCELLKSTQRLAKKKGLTSPICPPDVRAVCTGTECALGLIAGGGETALDPVENLDKFYAGLEKHQQLAMKKV